MDAYGFTLQKQLCELLGMSSGTVSTWIRRNYFPGVVVVTCALDSGVSLQWLAAGKGTRLSHNLIEAIAQKIPHKIFSAGVLKDAGTWLTDLSFVQHSLTEPAFISSNIGAWIIDQSISGVRNGRWLLGIDDKFDV